MTNGGISSVNELPVRQEGDSLPRLPVWDDAYALELAVEFQDEAFEGVRGLQAAA